MSNWGRDRDGRHRTTAELVVDVVRGQIERGQLRPGQRLPPERELAARLGVSRPSVRTGLRTLATLGIVRTRHGSGTYVTEGPPRLDARPLRMLSALHGFRAEHLDEARRLLEISVAGLAAERAGGEHLTAMAEQVSGMFASAEDPQGFAAHDARFHRAIATAGGNPILGSIVEMVTRLFFEQSRALSDRNAGGSTLARPAAPQHLPCDPVERRGARPPGDGAAPATACGAAGARASPRGRGLVRDIQFIEQAPGPRGSPQRPHGEAAGAFARGDAAGPPTAKVESARSRSAPWQ